MTWEEFPFAAYSSMAFWALGSLVSLAALKKDSLAMPGRVLMMTGSVIMTVFLVLFWAALDRPPLRTLGETRLWYAVLIPMVGFLVEFRWKIGWLKYYCMALAALFLGINLMAPDVYDKSLMPALQSVWFVPHVVVYLVGYVLLAASSAAAWHLLFRARGGRGLPEGGERVSHYLALLGFVFLSFGLVFGALWAKEAWGHYWTWDPKETWALIAWLAYLGYLHANAMNMSSRTLQWYLGLAFLVLLVSWFGVNYLPSAQNSVHSYQTG
ncbi:cytochrome c biogenesis protein CcsA [Prosthecochloris sp. N3]|uniref:Cytochrome c biogenesis protein CcsA n=1 Tax=Prosthecochloris ethylica TaxID=2743976 RepID=A0ABR9XNI5_9CHLB|nr:cytochrome c biogenesis protein CcsA [Prosthecochloris ethylica]MBF0585669.1 cytochrome c biogenesis protein CcsA [Prosthecochloris ethylica]MBF0635579.1 cytochrome c biogenesis protein CcsA [Prosthecochloris ethylica]MEC9487337.1 cytochrome c biogenesis protein CcsA [Prosthecochloris sp.]NUK46878.1 cytochrome c biogenesis protein CcsA [Prosthecochloris ethylica]